ncbi:MAG TPA: YceI family protein [Thermoanaerobaculia bacterium]|nr:YceI family protein [Thermoanaerobaculia bacterium]
MTLHRFAAGLSAVLLVEAAAAAAPPERIRFVLDPARTTITFQLPAFLHTVHGTFPLKRGSLEVDPQSGDASGEIVVDVAAGQTANASRDQRMHNEVLESSQYPEAFLLPDRVSGAISASGDSTVDLAMRLRLHGAEHALTLKIQVQRSGDEARVVCRFPIPYVEWGMKNPSTALLHVADRVTMEIQAAGRVEPAP